MQAWTPPPTQATLPTTDDEQRIEESIKIERNSRGYNWSFRLKREPGEPFVEWVGRCNKLDNHLRINFGNGN